MKSILTAGLWVFVVLSATGAVAGAPPAASVDEVAALTAELQRMQREMAAMQARLQQLSERQQAATAERTSAPTATTSSVDRDRVASLEQQVADLSNSLDEVGGRSSWTDKISIKGDFRYRYENIDEDGRAERERQRLRARVDLSAMVNDNTKVGLRLASGGIDPVSTNQSFDALATTKDIRLDRAYVAYAFNDQFSVTGGKMGVPFYKPGKSTLLWDGDLNPEGLNFSFVSGGLFAHASNWVLEENSINDDSYMHGAQVGYALDIGAGTLTLGGGYYKYDFAALLDLFAVENFEAFAEYATELAEHPLVVYLDYVTNNEADDFDTGYRVGFNYGKVKTAGSWDFGMSYNEVERNALFGAFSESDFAGGGTDGDGWIFKGGIGLGKNASFGATYFLNDRGINTVERDYDRLQVDFKYKY